MKYRATDWARRQRLVRPRLTHVTYYRQHSEVPRDLPRDVVAVTGAPEKPQWAIFECPCGTGHRIMVNLSPTARPQWRLSAGKAGPSLSPSVDFLDAFGRCHFWLRDGVVRFTRDSRRIRSRRDVSAQNGQTPPV